MKFNIPVLGFLFMIGLVAFLFPVKGASADQEGDYFVFGIALSQGSINPRLQRVQSGQSASMAIEPDTGFVTQSVTGCNGNLDGNLYTTDPGSESCLVVARFVPAAPIVLNDTGMDWCADSSSNRLDCPVAGHPLQDGDLGRDALARDGLLRKVGGGSAGFDFTKLGANGRPLAVQDMPWSDGGNEIDGTQWSCVRDNHTGLIWEVKTNDPNDLHFRDHTYTWYDPASPDGGTGTPDGGICNGSACDTSSYVQAVNEQGLCGASDWRMPGWQTELFGLTDFSRSQPAIDTDYFPNTASADFWTSLPYPDENRRSARSVYFGIASGGVLSRDSAFHVRLVREARRSVEGR